MPHTPPRRRRADARISLLALAHDAEAPARRRLRGGAPAASAAALGRTAVLVGYETVLKSESAIAEGVVEITSAATSQRGEARKGTLSDPSAASE
jgi:hypothetical protein